MEEQPDLIDSMAIPRLQDQYPSGFDYYQSFTDWDFENNTPIRQSMMMMAPQAQAFEPSVRTPAPTEQSKESPIVSKSILGKAFPRQSDKVQKHSHTIPFQTRPV